MHKVLTKPATQSAKYNVDFTDRLASGETVTSVSSVAADTPSGASALTISGVTYTSPKAQFTVAGGTNGYLYTITATVGTSDGNTLVGCVKLRIGC